MRETETCPTTGERCPKKHLHNEGNARLVIINNLISRNNNRTRTVTQIDRNHQYRLGWIRAWKIPSHTDLSYVPSPWWCSIHHHPDHQAANLNLTYCCREGVDPGERNVKYTENEMTIWNKWQWNMPNNRRKMSTEASTPWKGCKALHHPQSDQQEQQKHKANEWLKSIESSISLRLDSKVISPKSYLS